MQPIDPVDFVARMRPALRQAAAIARALEGRVPNRPKRAERGAVKQAWTVADTAAQEAILSSLLEFAPRVRLEAEEDTPIAACFARDSDALVIVDPIDGTFHSYLGAEGPYAVLIGLVQEGRYTAALTALPREGLFFDATATGPAWLERVGGEPREVHARSEGTRVLVSHGMPRAAVEALRREGFDVTPACGGAVAVAPLIPGVRAGLRHHGSDFGVSIRGRIGALVAHRAGCVVSGADGRAFPLDLETPAPVLITAACAEDARLLGDVASEVLRSLSSRAVPS